MISPKTETKVSPARSYGWMAEYADEHQLLDACRKVRDSGYTRTDAFVPFPVHGIDEALGIRPTVLPWIVLCFGLTGMSLALLMEWWMNAVSYPYIISGKPFFSLPAFIPVMFETTILFSVFSSFIGMVLLNGLPRYNNAVFTNPKFDRATDDRFFLWVDSRDKYFNSEKVKTLLESTSPLSVEIVKEDESSDVVPSSVWRAVAALILLTLIPAAVVLRMRASRSEEPRWHVFFDMDFQPKKRAQTTSTLFADNRASRPPVAGTVARGDLTENDPYYLGYTPEDLALIAAPSATRMVALQDDAAQDDAAQDDAAQDDAAQDEAAPSSELTAALPDEGNAPAPAADQPAEQAAESDAQPPADAAAEPEAAPADSAPANEAPANQAPTEEAATASAAAQEPPAAENAPPAAAPVELPWLTKFPFDQADEQMMALGKLKFETNCALCHGYAGDGDGLVARRAVELAQSYWLQPTSLHDPAVQNQPVGRIYHTITNGRGKMAPYGTVLTPKERWAIVLYVEALQRSRNAKLDDVPEAQRARLTTAPAK